MPHHLVHPSAGLRQCVTLKLAWAVRPRHGVYGMPIWAAPLTPPRPIKVGRFSTAQKPTRAESGLASRVVQESSPKHKSHLALAVLPAWSCFAPRAQPRTGADSTPALAMGAPAPPPSRPRSGANTSREQCGSVESGRRAECGRSADGPPVMRTARPQRCCVAREQAEPVSGADRCRLAAFRGTLADVGGPCGAAGLAPPSLRAAHRLRRERRPRGSHWQQQRAPSCARRRACSSGPSTLVGTRRRGQQLRTSPRHAVPIAVARAPYTVGRTTPRVRAAQRKARARAAHRPRSR